MAAQAKRKRGFEQVEADVHHEMDRLHALRWSLVPLRGTDVIEEDGTVLDAKGPTVKFRDRKALPLHVVWRMMAKAGSLMYGIRLKNVVIVDIDTDTPEAAEYVERRFGNSSLQVKTKRGRHHYFQIGTTPVIPERIREPGISIDIKAGENSIVVGPMSVRTDGVVYEYEVGILDRRTKLPVYVDRKPKTSKGSGAKGERHYMILAKACQFAHTNDSLEELTDELLAIRNWECDEAETVPDDEVRKVAAWAWKKRLENNLWGGRDSVVKIRRTALDVLGQHEYGGDAFLLYGVLQSNHGHILPPRPFAIVPGAMRKAGLINMSEQRIRRARDVLIETGLLVETARRKGYQQPNQYRLTRGPSQEGQGEGAVRLH